MFDVGSNWTTGGSVEISADQVFWATIYDSGRGTVFGSRAVGPLLFPFPKQTVRYLRITDYFMVDQGVGAGGFSELQVF